VVLATDFGVGAQPAARDRLSIPGWLRFARYVGRVGAPLIAFVPLPPARWPLPLARKIVLVHWDARTTVGTVRRLVGAGHELPE
jgi:hypothetical protein